ncbi:MAG: hypothetical protein KDM63_08305, partial [Verrucomicrobiae bacterium]|nr:hypothetical protein [Verrucomicrobiae bacterium]
MEITVEAPEIRFGFGQPVSSCHGEGASAVCDLSVPLLAGLGDEPLIRGGDADRLERHGAFQVLRNSEGGVIGGVAVAPCAGAAEMVAHRLYSELLGIAGEQALYRIWNFVPGINSEVEGIEQYQSFNVGRCRAFRERFGESGMEDRLPAAFA